tara:strand:- start:800 stop:1078 length:279 start_codon:yes stop_codon:yes gene_type:complete
MILYGRRMQKDNFIKKKEEDFIQISLASEVSTEKEVGLMVTGGVQVCRKTANKGWKPWRSAHSFSRSISIHKKNEDLRRPPLNDPPLRAWDI